MSTTLNFTHGVTSCLVTGGGSGIGRAVSLELFKKGCNVLVVDLDGDSAAETCRLGQKSSPPAGQKPIMSHFQCNVIKPEELSAAFARHASLFGRLDVCFNNAGLGEGDVSFLDDAARDRDWRTCIEVNLTAMVHGTKLAVSAMRASKLRGVVLNTASAAGTGPSPFGPVYAAAKAGVVNFVRSLAWLEPQDGIRVCALCPQFIDTALVRRMAEVDPRGSEKLIASAGGLIPMAMVVEGALELIEGRQPSARGGACMLITLRRGRQYWPLRAPKERSRQGTAATSTSAPDAAVLTGKAAPANQSDTPRTVALALLPLNFKKLSAVRLTTDFRNAVQIVQVPLLAPAPGQVVIQVVYAGINASDINMTAGRYYGGAKEAAKKLPFDVGFEVVGVIVSLGPGVAHLRPGDAVAAMTYGAFAEYLLLPAKHVIPVPACSPQVVALLTSGLTASLALEKAGRMGSGETVLVTAAAGGTGQFAVQLAKMAGNRVIGTCGSEDKAAMLRGLGADVCINYKDKDLGKALAAACPEGVDLVYESVGGPMFDACLASLKPGGRLIIIGMMSQYAAGGGEGKWALSECKGLCEKLLWKSQQLCGFFLLHYGQHFQAHFQRLFALYASGQLKVEVDPRLFVGIESVADAVDHLQSGRSSGKVVVQIARDVPAVRSKM
eukprot:jgi/Mesvir1/4270/Mv22230-RA.1